MNSKSATGLSNCRAQISGKSLNVYSLCWSIAPLSSINLLRAADYAQGRKEVVLFGHVRGCRWSQYICIDKELLDIVIIIMMKWNLKKNWASREDRKHVILHVQIFASFCTTRRLCCCQSAEQDYRRALDRCFAQHCWIWHQTMKPHASPEMHFFHEVETWSAFPANCLFIRHGCRGYQRSQQDQGCLNFQWSECLIISNGCYNMYKAILYH